MGKFTHNTQIKHSTHPHLLHLSSNLHLQNPINCSVCNLHISPSDHHIYTCTPCNFFLHPSCSNFQDIITHPSHPHHTLSLLPTTPHDFFRCVACAQQGNRFSYRCRICDFDLHVLCASKPISVTNPIHPHPLVINFSSPYGENIEFLCNLCRGVGSSDQWLYHCVSCQFDAHLHCATAKTPPPPPPTAKTPLPPPPLQHQHSFPNQFVAPPLASQPLTQSHQHSFPNQYVAAQPLTHSASAGHVPQCYWRPPPNPAPVGYQSYQPPPPAPVGYQLPSIPALPTQNIGVASGLANVMVTRFVGGVIQQVGQNLVQGLIGGDDGEMLEEIVQEVAESFLD